MKQRTNSYDYVINWNIYPVEFDKTLLQACFTQQHYIIGKIIIWSTKTTGRISSRDQAGYFPKQTLQNHLINHHTGTQRPKPTNCGGTSPVKCVNNLVDYYKWFRTYSLVQRLKSRVISTPNQAIDGMVMTNSDPKAPSTQSLTHSLTYSERWLIFNVKRKGLTYIVKTIAATKTAYPALCGENWCRRCHATHTQKTITGTIISNRVKIIDRASGPNINLPPRRNFCKTIKKSQISTSNIKFLPDVT